MTVRSTSPVSQVEGSAPSTTPTERQTYQKIELTKGEKFLTVVRIIFSIGLYLVYQNHRCEKALINGDIATAENAIRSGASPSFSAKEIIDLTKIQGESIKFLIAQIEIPAETLKNPSLLSGSARELISARDDYRSNIGTAELLIEVLPFQTYPQTYLCRETFKERDLLGIDIPIVVRRFEPPTTDVMV